MIITFLSLSVPSASSATLMARVAVDTEVLDKSVSVFTFLALVTAIRKKVFR